MRSRYALLLILAATLAGCGSDAGPTEPPEPSVLLRDVVLSSLPSPFFHFEYDGSDRLSRLTYASETRIYTPQYQGDRLIGLQDDPHRSGDRLAYRYDDAGRIAGVDYIDRNGVLYSRTRLVYGGALLTGLERARRIGADFVVEKTLAMTYDPAGNLVELVEHHPPIDTPDYQQPEVTLTDRFEQYDTGVNVDDFSLLHSEYFDHVLLLPRVRLQRGNPARVTRTGDGSNYILEYSYSYDTQQRPVTRLGTLTMTTGPDAGRVFQLRSDFSYY